MKRTHQPKPGNCPFCGQPYPCLNHGTGQQHQH